MLKYKYVNGSKKHIQKVPWKSKRDSVETSGRIPPQRLQFSVLINQIEAFFLRTGIPRTEQGFASNSMVSLAEVN